MMWKARYSTSRGERWLTVRALSKSCAEATARIRKPKYWEFMEVVCD